MLSFGEKIAKISPVDPAIIVLREIIKKRKKKKKKKLTQKAKYIDLPASLPSGLNYIIPFVRPSYICLVIMCRQRHPQMCDYITDPIPPDQLTVNSGRICLLRKRLCVEFCSNCLVFAIYLCIT